MRYKIEGKTMAKDKDEEEEEEEEEERQNKETAEITRLVYFS